MRSVPICQEVRDKLRFDRKLCAAKISMRSATQNTRECGTKKLHCLTVKNVELWD